MLRMWASGGSVLLAHYRQKWVSSGCAPTVCQMDVLQAAPNSNHLALHDRRAECDLQIVRHFSIDGFYKCNRYKNAEYLAKHFGFGYTKVDDEDTLSRVLDNFFKHDVKAKILEVDTSAIENSAVLKQYFEFLK